MPIKKVKPAVSVPNPMKALRVRLSALGIKKGFLNEVVLPSWWDDEIAITRAGFLEGAGYICARLGYNLTCLVDEEKSPAFVHSLGVKYKKSKDTTAAEVGFATQYALGVARTVATSLAGSPCLAPLPAPEIWRQALLAASNQPWVNLPRILEAAWSVGVPVIHVRNVPSCFKKPDALTTMVDIAPSSWC